MADAAGHRKQVSRIFYGKMARNMGDPWQNNWTPSGAAKGNRLSIDWRGRLGCDAWDAANEEGSACTSDMTQWITIEHHLVTDAANKKGSESASDIKKWIPNHCVTDAANKEGSESVSDITKWIPHELGKNSTNGQDSGSISSKAKWIPRGPASTSDITKWSPNHRVTDAANEEGLGPAPDITKWIPHELGKNSTNEQDSGSTPSKAKWIPRGPASTSDMTKWIPNHCVTDAVNEEVSGSTKWSHNYRDKGTNCSFECKPGCQTAGVAADAGGITASGSFHNYRMRNYDRQQTRSPLKPESNWRAQCKMGKNIVEPPARIPQKNQMHSRHHPSPSDGPNEKKTPIEISNWRIRPAIVESPSKKESEPKTEPKPKESDKNSIKNVTKQIDKSTKSNEKSIGKNSRKNGNKLKKRDAKKNVILELSMLYVDEPRHKNRFELLDTSD